MGRAKLVLPLAFAALVVAPASLVLDTARLTLPEFPVIVHEAPDVGLALFLIAVLGVGWGLVRTVMTARTLRGTSA